MTSIILLGACSVKPVGTDESDSAVFSKVDSLIQEMTLEEKVGQMLNLGLAALLQGPFYHDRDTLEFDKEKLKRLLLTYGAGSVQNKGSFPLTPKQWRNTIAFLQDYVKKETRLGIPILYGIDAVHGANYTVGSVMLPHQINLAATFNLDLTKKAGEITAYELKASAIPWNYAPVLDVARHPMWGRIFESFGEDTYLTTELGAAMIKGLQGENAGARDKVLACPKHFLGYGASYNGKDRSPVNIPEKDIYQILLPPFERAIEDGLLSIMISSGSLNGIPSHVDYHLITELLKGKMGFRGIVISDWNDIDNLHGVHKVAEDERDAVKKSVLAGLDMCMEPYDESFAIHLIDLVKSGEVPESRIDDAVSRILYVKFKTGLFNDPLFEKYSYDEFASERSDSLNYCMASESMTLLKNRNKILPLSGNEKILVTGVAANSINYLNGAWSRTWAGQDTRYNDKNKATILQAFEKKLGKKNVLYTPGTGYEEEIDIEKSVELASNADVIVACVGEIPATEKPSDIEELDLPEVQQKLVAELAKTGKPVVLVMVQGRPRIIRRIEPLCDGILMAYLPGNEGGRAIVDVLLGNENPSGKLPYTYPRYSGSLWTYDHQLSDERDVNFGLEGFNPQYEFGHGLSYTSFNYTDLRLSDDSISLSDDLIISVQIENTGSRYGKEAVMLFISDEVASIAPPVKLLKRFSKVELLPGEKKQVQFTLSVDDLKFVNAENEWVPEPGYFTVNVSGQTTRFYLFE